MELKIKREPGRFFVVTDRRESYLVYKLVSGIVDIVEVFVHEEHRGQGIAAELCKAAVAFAKEHNYKIAPSCDYVKNKFVPEHPEIKDMLVEGDIFYKAQKR